MTKSLTSLFIICLFLFSCNFKSEEADVILHNANIYTANDQQAFASAVAIKDNRIVSIGAERQIMNVFKAKKHIDCKKNFVYPGFIDAHCHFVRYGLDRGELDLVGTKSWEECIERIANHRAKHPNQEWIIGFGWDQNDWEIKEFPNRKILDDLYPDIPISLTRIDGHASIINAKAMELVGINKDSEFEGGEVLKFSNGEVTGLLIDNAMEMVRLKIGQKSETEIKEGILAAQKDCFKVGLTSIVDAGLSVKEVEIIKSMYEKGELKIRIYAMLSPSDEALKWIEQNGVYQDDNLSIRSIKLYGDGALGSRGALLKRPYSDHGDNVGIMRETPAFYEEWATYAKHYNYQLNTHCIGDSANGFIMNMYARFLEGPNDRRWRIEHAQVVDPSDMDMFREYSIIPSVQPTHATSDMYWAQDRLGSDRMEGAYAYKSLLKQNGIIALGTDFPIEEIDPLDTFFAAVHRKDHQGYPQEGFIPSEALSPEECIKGMTIWAALANFEDSLKGSIEKGKLADFTVVNVDMLNSSEELHKKAEVVKTILGGEVVYTK